MEAKELRIGNLLQDGVSKSLLKVIELSEKDITTYVIDRSKFPLEKGWFTEPIPLTEEWLIKAVFEQGVWQNETLDQELYSDYNTLFISDSRDTNYSFRSPCKYVHQLQNLYFALTGKELAITL
jgi:hypothetical protein